MEHQFNTNVAETYGVDGAIILHNLYFWIRKNEANRNHFYDGFYWTYNSIEAFTELFPYWSRRQIERIISNLTEKGAIIKGNYNKSTYDRTTWYAITETVKCIYANGEMDSTKNVNGFTQTVVTIPDSKPDSKQDNKPNKDKNIPELSEFLEYAKSVYENDLGLKYSNYEFSLESKYQSWVDAKWKDGNGSPILNWKTKLRSTIPHLKEMAKASNEPKRWKVL